MYHDLLHHLFANADHALSSKIHWRLHVVLEDIARLLLEVEGTLGDEFGLWQMKKWWTDMYHSHGVGGLADTLLQGRDEDN